MKRTTTTGLFALGCFSALTGMACSGGPGDENSSSSSESLNATYEVGPGRAFPDLQTVAPRLAPGDTVNVYGKSSPYAGGIIFANSGTVASPITIRGVRVNGQRPVISGGSTGVEFRANNYVFEGFDVTASSVRNIFHHGDKITIRDSVVHNCGGHGILGADADSGSLTLDYVEVYACGLGTGQHPVYIATDETAHPGSVFRMQHCYLHNQNGGNNVKSRAERNEIYYNWIEGGFYREIELIGPDGQDPKLAREDSDVVGNVFLKTQGTYVSRIGGDGTYNGDTSGRYRFVNNTIILQQGSSAAVQVFGQVESLEMHNNVFYRLGGGGVQVTKTTDAIWTTGSPVTAGENNWVATGSSGVPAGFTRTMTGAEPGFVNSAAHDFHLASGAALINQGATTLSGPSGYPFPSPLTTPLFMPPSHVLEAPGAAVARAVLSTIDVSGFAHVSTSAVANVPPTVSITAPSAGASVLSPGPVTITANAADSDDSVSKVDFIVNGAVVGSSPTAPYRFVWNNVSVGQYTLTARATDSQGATTLSAPVTLNATAPVPPPTGATCLSSSGTWQNQAFTPQSGTFTAEADVTPLGSFIDGAVALSSGAQSSWAGLASIALFSTSGKIVARNGGSYAATSTISYTGNMTYHFRIVVNVPQHVYSVYVTPLNGAEVTLASNFAFRTEQSSVASLDHWDVGTDLAGSSLRACAMMVH